MKTFSSATRRAVWVVDDSPLEAEMARSALATDYDVRVFGDGSTVLEAVAAGAVPDVLVLDWYMPGVSGLDVCRFLRSRADAAHLAILVLTGERGRDDVVHALAAGANDYVTKPYAPAELAARVASLARTRALFERAEQAESSLTSLLEQLPDALLVFDAAGRVSFANATAEGVFQVAREALVGRAVAELVPGWPAVAVAQPTAPAPDVRLGGAVYAPALRQLRLPDGSTGTILMLRDVTEKRRQESHRLDFYAIIAHDLRSPLSALILRTHLLLEGRHGELSPRVREDLGRMRARMDDMVALINDFLDLASLEEVGLKLDIESFELGELIRETMEALAPTAAQSGVELHCDSCDEEMVVAADRRRIAQVIDNLLTNAIKFAPGGRVRVEARADAHEIQCAVIDNGRGIAPDVAATLFQRYVRPKPARDVRGAMKGTGLGLMIVREIVEAHGGRVELLSEPGQGSAFRFHLPRPERPS